MLRNDWKFPYPAAILLAAARKKADYHQERLTWWRAKRDVVIQSIKDSGLQVSGSLSGIDTSKFSNYREPSVRIDNVLLKDMDECVAKTREHRGLLDSYNSWIEILASQGQTHVDLDHDDWLFFFQERLARTDEDEDEDAKFNNDSDDFI